jgi:hypothetical protein
LGRRLLQHNPPKAVVHPISRSSALKLPYSTLGADQRAAVAAILGRIIPASTKARAAINELESSWQRGAPFRETLN